MGLLLGRYSTRGDEMPVIVTELYDALREAGVTDEKARSAAVVRDDAKITKLQMRIDERLAHLERDLKWLKWGAVFLLLAVAAPVAAVFLFGKNLFKGVAWLPNL
jgi:hypothetical protein